jgi:hypothetical protein
MRSLVEEDRVALRANLSNGYLRRLDEAQRYLTHNGIEPCFGGFSPVTQAEKRREAFARFIRELREAAAMPAVAAVAPVAEAPTASPTVVKFGRPR